MRTLRILKSDKKGIAIVFVAIVMLLLIGFAGLAVDVGYMYVVKGQLQNAADAGALAGVGVLDPVIPDWTVARNAAAVYAKKNKAAGTSITDPDVRYGYWNLPAKTWKAGSPVSSGTPPGAPAGTCSVTKAACTSAASCPQFPAEGCDLQEVPAVMATISRSADNNDGPVPTVFARVLGFDSMSPSANSVAAVGAPGWVSGAFPFVLSSCVVNDYFSQKPLPAKPPLITDTSVYHLRNGVDLASPGQWTSLTPDKANSAKLLKDYIATMIDPSVGKASPILNTGDSIWIDPGTIASVYHATQDLIDAGKGLVIMPVVGSSGTCTMTPKTSEKIVGFVAVRLTSTTNSSMTGEFVQYFPSNPNIGKIIGGINNNLATLPTLIK